MLELLKRGNFWVMLSLGEKISKAGKPWDDVIPIMRAYIEAAPDRCVWASDWPHPVSVKQPPNDADLLELMYRYAPDQAELEKILVTIRQSCSAFRTSKTLMVRSAERASRTMRPGCRPGHPSRRPPLAGSSG